MMPETASKPKRPFGRSLTDFENLSEAEKKLIDCVARGEPCVLGDEVPDTPTRATAIRPELIRFLALGGDESAPVHEKGVQLQGAYIGAAEKGEKPSELDLDGCKLSTRVGLLACHFAAPIILRHAEGLSIALPGSTFPGFHADGLKLDGDLSLHRVRSTGTARLLGAEINGDLMCRDGQFENAEGEALSCDHAEIGGSVFLDGSFRAIGEVRFLGSKLDGNLYCNAGRFDNAHGNALSCDGAEIGGDVSLKAVHATGEVGLLGARIGGNLSCSGGQFKNADGDALCCQGAEIRGGFVFRSMPATIGAVSLAHMQVATLVDDLASWPEKALNLDGFRYERIAASSPLDAKSRIAWLNRQMPEFVGEWFALQPWMHLAKVLREQGHFRDAAEVDIARENWLRAAGKVSYPWIHWAYGKFAGYGYRPDRVLIIAFLVWTVSMALYAFAAENGGFAPTSPAIYLKPDFEHCRPDAQEKPENGKRKIGNWTHCPDLPSEYPAFSPFAFSTDLILPVMHLGQSNFWGPTTTSRKVFSAGNSVQCWMWLEEAFGWVAALTLGAIAAGLVKRRDG
ncbi:MAG: hypothetical protein CTY36_09110 [Methylocystis sp.]|nr:MAG: hypothetical protein CTY36_09110 [Methylocystis sp.]